MIEEQLDETVWVKRSSSSGKGRDNDKDNDNDK